jgi:drug/metabolite transporter (DMT)-like permease
MSDTNSRTTWLLFIALGFMWGSSYLFIKLAVDDFGTFTLVALRLAVGAALLWLAIRLARQELPREPRLYGHLVVMAIVNIVIPFALITWAEQTVDSSLAAILTSAVPLFAIIIAPLFLHDEPIRVNGVVGLIVGFVGVVVLTSNELAIGSGDLSGEIALLGAALSYAIGAVYARRNTRGVPPMIPAVFQVTFALVISGAVAVLFERPWEARPDLEAVFSILWLGILGSGLAYLALFRILAVWGATRTTLVAYEIPVWGIILGFLVLNEPVDLRVLIGTGLVVGGVALVNSKFGRRQLYGRVPPPVEAEAKAS